MKAFVQILGVTALCGAMLTGGTARADTVVFQDDNRQVLSDWIYENNHGCPAGTIAKETERYLGLVHPQHSCVIPKGATMTYYKPGTTIPSTVTYTELPGNVVSQLPPPPSGAVYVTNDSGVYLVNPQTRTVVDSVNVYSEEQ